MLEKIFGKPKWKQSIDLVYAFENMKTLYDGLDTDLDKSSEKYHLANNLVMFGVVGAACDIKKLPDDMYVAVLASYFNSKEVPQPYLQAMFKASQQPKDSATVAAWAIQKGGQALHDTLKGNEDAPLQINLTIQRYVDDPNFPNSYHELSGSRTTDESVQPTRRATPYHESKRTTHALPQATKSKVKNKKDTSDRIDTLHNSLTQIANKTKTCLADKGYSELQCAVTDFEIHIYNLYKVEYATQSKEYSADRKRLLSSLKHKLVEKNVATLNQGKAVLFDAINHRMKHYAAYAQDTSQETSRLIAKLTLGLGCNLDHISIGNKQLVAYPVMTVTKTYHVPEIHADLVDAECRCKGDVFFDFLINLFNAYSQYDSISGSDIRDLWIKGYASL